MEGTVSESTAAVSSFPLSKLLPNLARNPASRPASSASTFNSSFELGFQRIAFRVSLVDRYTGCGDVVRMVNALPSERVTNWVKVYGRLGRLSRRAFRHD